MIQRDAVVFAPDDGTWTLQGERNGDHVEASHARPSFDHKVFTTKLVATVSDTKVVGKYSTPSCTYAVDLTKF